MSNKHCNCYISKMDINCERIADIIKMIQAQETDIICMSWFINDLINEGTISNIEAIIVSTQIGIKIGVDDTVMPEFSNN
jgi:hypothetical protein